MVDITQGHLYPLQWLGRSNVLSFTVAVKERLHVLPVPKERKLHLWIEAINIKVSLLSQKSNIEQLLRNLPFSYLPTL